ncbi:MAG TPA: translation elongation factor Ts [Verrucomicrobiales bacterium]|nr:translation elongation factor Ts [Verrucomicrobiales bacterium]HIL23898.1 translation elongation factor Ts [Verrucomicrobiota bacterium]
MADITVAQISKLRQQTSAGMMDCKKALTESGGDHEAAVDWLRKKGAVTAAKKSSRATSEGIISHQILPGAKAGILLEVNCETDFVGKNESFQNLCADFAQSLLEDPNADLEARRTTAVAEVGENIVIQRHARLEVEGHGAIAAYIHHGAKVGVLVQVSTGKEATAESDEFKSLLRDITLQIAAASPEAVDRTSIDPTLIAKEKEIATEQFKDKPAQAIEKIVEGKLEKHFSTVCLVDQAFVKQGDLAVKDHISATAKVLDDTITVDAFLRYQVGETGE